MGKGCVGVGGVGDGPGRLPEGLPLPLPVGGGGPQRAQTTSGAGVGEREREREPPVAIVSTSQHDDTPTRHPSTPPKKFTDKFADTDLG